jgi:hypothetical protein
LADNTTKELLRICHCDVIIIIASKRSTEQPKVIRISKLFVFFFNAQTTGAGEMDEALSAFSQDVTRFKYPGANFPKDHGSPGAGTSRRSCPAFGKTTTSDPDGAEASALFTF